jgi:hypothetical protein
MDQSQTQNATRAFNIGLLIITIVGVVLITFNLFNRPAVPSTNIQPSDSQALQGNPEIIAVDNKIQINTGAKKLNLPTGWKIDLALSSDKNSGYKCLGSNCIIYLVSSANNFSLSQVAITVPAAVVTNNAVQSEKTKVKHQFLGQTVEFSVISAALFVGEAETGKLVIEKYGCANNICINAVFSEEQALNAKQIKEFEQALKLFTLK